MHADRLFTHIERLQGGRPWGRVLDAGTGRHSLQWLTGLDTARWTAVTGEKLRAERLARELGVGVRAEDEIICGNWTDPLFLHGEVYDVVLADYLLGAIEGFAPHFQDRLFDRLRPHVGERLYLIGLEPYEPFPDSRGGQLIQEIARLRDACILLAGDRCYREFPLEWVLRHLELAGFVVEDAQIFPIRYGERFIEGQLDVCERKLPRIRGPARLVEGIRQTISSVRKRALDHASEQDGILFGEDYVVLARPR